MILAIVLFLANHARAKDKARAALLDRIDGVAFKIAFLAGALFAMASCPEFFSQMFLLPCCVALISGDELFESMAGKRTNSDAVSNDCRP